MPAAQLIVSLVYVAIPIVVFVMICLWMLVIRPYCLRNRKGYTPGANMFVSFWVNLQEAREIAEARNDQGMLWLCRIMVIAQLALLVLLAGNYFFDRA